MANDPENNNKIEINQSWPAFRPDSAYLNASSTDAVQGVYPSGKTDTGIVYSPFPSAYSSGFGDFPGKALTATTYQAEGHSYNYAADLYSLYLYDKPTKSWTSIKTYNSPADDRQSVIFNGEAYFVDGQNYLTVANKEVVDEIPDTPLGAKLITTSKNFVILGNWTGNEQSIQWSALGNGRYWPAPGTEAATVAQSGTATFPGTHGNLKGLVGEVQNAAALLIYESSVYKLQYTGNGDVWEADKIDSSTGTIATNSIVTAGGIAYWYSNEGFIACDGSSFDRIGFQKVDTWFHQNVDLSNLSKVTATHLPDLNSVVWSFPSAGSTFNNWLLIYNYLVGEFAFVEEPVDCFLTGYTNPWTLEEIDTISTDIEQVPLSFDSDFFNATKRVYLFFQEGRVLTFGGTGRTCSLTSQIIESPNDLWVNNVRPLYQGPSPELKLIVMSRDNEEQDWCQKSAPLNTRINNGKIPLRARGRLHRFKIETSSSTITKLLGLRINGTGGGSR